MYERRGPHDALTQSGGWPTAIRGLLAIVFGVIALTSPGSTALAFVILFALWAFIDGGMAFVVAARRGREGLRWGWFVFEGIVSIAAGVLALAYPHLTVLALTIIVAARAIVLGAIEIYGAIASREAPHRWLYGLTGVVSVLFGAMLLWHPLVGALALIWTIGMYAIVAGVMLLALGIQVGWREHREHTERAEHGPRGEPWGQQTPNPAQG
jgi:uncharacterized membrane protein HdeD (DUF308 family)